jgi:hypothetical protein
LNLEFIKGEYEGNRVNLVRETIQRKQPFAVFTFSNPKIYRQFLTDLSKFAALPYVRQTFMTNHQMGGYPIIYPSIFVTNVGSDVSDQDFKNMMLGSLKQYHIDSIICLYAGQISSYYKNGDKHTIGTDIYTSLNPQEFETYYFKVESTCYTFV